YFFNDKREAVDKEHATQIEIHELDKDGNSIFRTYGTIERSKTEVNTHMRSHRLRVPQVRILRALAASGMSLTREEIVSTFPPGSKFHEWLWRPLGQLTAELRQKYESNPRGYPSLISLGYVNQEGTDVNGNVHWAFRITDAGLSALREYDQKGGR